MKGGLKNLFGGKRELLSRDPAYSNTPRERLRLPNAKAIQSTLS